MRRPFHGWRIVAFAAVVMAMTAPGQTAGVSPFIDPVMADLGLSRSAISTAYLVGTLVGAAVLPFVGRLVDRYGPRLAMAVIAAVFGGVLVGLSLVTEVFGLTAGFVGIRLTGQGALGLAAVTVVSHWFNRRRGTALGVLTAVGASGISLAPILIERLVAVQGWRTAWLIEGVAVWLIVIPLAVWGIRNRPADVGQHIDGQPSPVDQSGHLPGAGRAEAIRTPYFWVLVAGTAASALLSTAVIFHQISLLGERGLSPAQAAATFLPMTVAGVVATLAVGYLIDRFDFPRLLVVASMGLLAGGLLWATVLSPGWSALGYGAAMGAAANSIRAVEAALTPRMFGTGSIASIRSVLASVGVAASAVGPLMFAAAYEATGSYTAILCAGVALPAAVSLAALTVRLPAGHRLARSS